MYKGLSLCTQYTSNTASFSKTVQVTPTANSEVWSVDGNSLVTTKTIITNKLSVKLTPELISTDTLTDTDYVPDFYLGCDVIVTDTASGDTRKATLEWQGPISQVVKTGNTTLTYVTKQTELTIPNNWSSISFSYNYRTAISDGREVLVIRDWRYHEVTNSVKVRFPKPGDSLTLSTSYVDVNNTQYEYSQYTKKDLLGSSDTPLDYLLSFSKMFNLRFYQHPGSKIIDILSWDNWFTDKVDIQDWIDYSNYQAIPKVSDSKELHFGIEPDENTTVEEYLKVNSSVFDRTVPINPDSTSTEEYLDTNLKLGSRASLTGYYSVRPVNNLAYYGFDSPDSYKVGYLQDDELKTVDQNLARQFDNQRYTVLELSEVKNTIVLRCGTSVNNYGGESGKYPIAISRTSRLMVQYAGKPCFVGGFDLGASEGSTDVILGCPIKYTYQIPCFDVVSNTQGSGVSLSFSNVHYRSLNVSSNLFDTRFRLMLDQIYSRPLQVKTKVHWKAMPQLRQLYYFNNTFWMISEVSNYNYTDAPADTVFTRVLF